MPAKYPQFVRSGRPIAQEMRTAPMAQESRSGPKSLTTISFSIQMGMAQILPCPATMTAMAEDLDRLRAAYEERVRGLEMSVEQRERELMILSQAAARIHAAEEEEDVLQIALEEILAGLGLKAAWVFFGDDRERKLRLAASLGVAPSYLEHVRRDGLGECLCPEVFWTGYRMQARNTLQCPRMPQIVESLDSTVGHACIPLKFEGTTKGVLNVAARPDAPFSDDELRFLETLGHQMSLAVERARHRRAERQRDQESRAMAAISRSIGSSLDAAAVLNAVGETGREVLRAERACILLGSDARALRVAHLSGLPHPELHEGQALDLVAAGARLQLLALSERRAFVIDDWSHDERVNTELARRWDAGSGMIVPLLAGERVLGLLVLTRTEVTAWSGEQVEVAEALAAQAAVALENARLYEDARKAYRELKEAQDRIISTEKMAVLGTFASGLAHEVRNPLNSIALQLSILDRRIARLEVATAGQMADITRVIRDEVRRLDELVGDFLLFSRADRLQHRPAELEALVEEVVRLLRPEARHAGVTLKREQVGEPAGTLLMDAEKIKQVVINLVRNAVEAMDEGGTVVVGTGVRDGRVLLSVSDTGPGLPEGVDVFQLFVTTKPKGTGLGLSIVQQIVLQHGGEIRAQAAPGGGAAFVISLPERRAGAAQEGARQ
jgi:signal transduction histidine kinase